LQANAFKLFNMKPNVPPIKKGMQFRYLYFLLFVLTTTGFLGFGQAHLPECDTDVPFFNIDLSSNPDSMYTTPEIIRKTGCCGVNNEYVSFYVTLHPDVAMFELLVAQGYADPGGAGNYTIISGGDLSNPGACGTQIAGGGPICITGSGPHKIVYSKAGSNKIKYVFKQIPKPIYPISQPARIGCSLPLPIYGLNNIAIQAISKSGNLSASLATCNTFLSCLNCSNPVFQAGTNATYPYTITYQVTGIPIAAFCGTYPSTGTFTITVYNALTASITPNPAAFCAGGTGVQLTATATGGFGSYNFNWFNSTGDTVSMTSQYLADTAGTYTVQVKDGLISGTCAPAYAQVPVVMGSPPTVIAGSDQYVCATNPTILLNGSSSTGSGIWSNGTGTFQPGASQLTTSYTPSAAEINAGMVDLILTSSGTGPGCANSKDTVRIFISDSINISLAANPILCYNGTTSITSNISGGVTPYTYSWSNGNTGTSINATAGAYYLQITDSYGCQSLGNIGISQPDPIGLNITSLPDDGTCNGSATAFGFGGTPPFYFEWSNGETTQSIINLCNGIDTLIMTDSYGCTVAQSVVIPVPPCSAFSVNIDSLVHVSCFGGNDGTIFTSTSGGTGNISYQWTSLPPQNSPTATGLLSGYYSVMATDENGCIDIAGTTILQPTAITNSITHIDVSSLGGNDGSATANPSGGTPGYTYNWNPGGQTTQTASGLTSSNGGSVYHVQITDANLCSIEDSVMIQQPPCNNLLIGVNTTPVSCHGQSNGSAGLTITNGEAPFSINWSTGATNVLTLSNQPAGSYSVTVQDKNGCATFKNFSITQPAALTLGLNPTNVRCNGEKNGSIDLTVAGGTFPYAYSWTKGSTPFANHEDLIQLTPGTYTVQVTDANGCTESASIGITQPNPLTLAHSYTDNLCYQDSTGSIAVSVTGGKTPYQYNWEGPGTFVAYTEDLLNLGAGLYALVVTDLNDCSAGPLEVYINEPDSLSVTASLTAQVACLGQNNGQANASVLGGTMPYQYQWNGPNGYNSTSAVAQNMTDGQYIVTVSDNHNCAASDTISVTTILDTIKPTLTCIPNQQVTTSTTSCGYTKTGNSWNAVANDNCTVSQLSYTMSGSTSGSGTTLNNVVFNLGITTVVWTAVDSLGNSDSCTFTVEVDDIYSPGISNCSALVNRTVPMNPGACTFTQIGTNWNAIVTDNCTVSSVTYNLTGATTGSGTNLNNASFNLGNTLVTWTVIDNSGNSSNCSFTVQVIDNQAPQLTNCPSNILVGTAPGACNANVSWSPPTASDNCSVQLSGSIVPGSTFPVGNTTVTYTAVDPSGNSTNCQFTVTVVDNQLPQLIIPAPISTCDPTVIYTQPSATDNCGIQQLTQVSGLPSGSPFPIGTTTNTFQATDIHGNTTTLSFTVTVHPEPGLFIETENVSCYGYNNGSIDVTVLNGQAPYTFSWNTGDTLEDLQTLEAGFYTVNVTDGYGCSNTIGAELTEPTPLVLNASYQDVSCFGGANGSIDVSISGGVEPYYFAWSNGQTSEDAEQLTAGAYQLEVSDFNGCTTIYSTVINEPPPLTLQASTNDAVCSAKNGNIRVLISGGTSPYTYDWSNGANTMNLLNVSAGTYTLTVEDANNCTISYTGIVEAYSNLSAQLQVKDAVCYGEPSGEIQALVTSGTGPYTYEWSNGDSTPLSEGLTTGVYLVSITDANGCTTVLSDTIWQPEGILVTLETSLYSAGTEISTYGNNDGEIEVFALNGQAPYSYVWSTGQTTPAISGLTEGSYTVWVTDANGCKSSATVQLNDPIQLAMPSGFSPNGDYSNEFFVVRGIEAYPDNQLTIYNRWGNIVYQKEDYSNEWNGGNNNGEELPDGTYFVLLKAYATEPQTLKGYVDLRR
jgi:gliding motility-associated-like protein